MAHIAIGQNSVLNVYANIECTDGQQVIFQSDSARAAYFNNHRVAQFTGMSYVYHDGVVKVEAGPGTMVNANYISFNNPSFESKPIYARITDWKYINNKTVALTYEVDWFQTFMFDFTAQSSQISREHLSESDWAAAVSNPWRADIMELNQDEGIVLNPYDLESTDYHELQSTKDMYAAFLVAQTTVKYKDSDKSDINTRLAYFYKSFEDRHIKSPSFTQYGRMIMMGSYEAGVAIPKAANIVFIQVGETIAASGYDATVINDGYPEIKSGDSAIRAYVDLMTGAGLTNQILSVTAMTLAQIRELAGANNQLTISPTVGNSTDPKLKRYPFCYTELMSPAGNTTEYTYEGWQGNTPTFITKTAYDLSSRTVVPYKYLGKTLNYRERFDVSPLLQIPYTTDNFLTYLSQCYQKTADRETVAGALSAYGQAVTGAVQVGIGALELGSSAGTYGAAGAALAATNSAQRAATYARTQQSAVNNGTGAVGTIAGGLSDIGSAVGFNYDQMAAGGLRGHSGLYQSIFGDQGNLTDLVTSRESHPGSAYTPGVLPSVMSSITNPEYHYCNYYPTPATISLFEAYFAAYGYKTGRIGIPRVCNYINGSGSMPHWATIDGKSCTYVKTTGMKIIAPLKPAADYIRAIFDAGCRFVKG